MDFRFSLLSQQVVFLLHHFLSSTTVMKTIRVAYFFRLTLGRSNAIHEYYPYYAVDPEGESGVPDALAGPPLVGWQIMDATTGLDPIPSLTWLSPAEVAESKMTASFKAAASQNPRILCVAADDVVDGQQPGQEFAVSYQRSDLISLNTPPEKFNERSQELREVEGAWRTRKETLLVYNGDEATARRMWSAAAPAAAGSPQTVNGSDYASCLHGHYLHARCFQVSKHVMLVVPETK